MCVCVVYDLWWFCSVAKRSGLCYVVSRLSGAGMKYLTVSSFLLADVFLPDDFLAENLHG